MQQIRSGLYLARTDQAGQVESIVSLGVGLLILALASLAPISVSAQGGAQDEGAMNMLAFGDPLIRVQCTDGYTPYIHAENLVAPHGIAFGPDGRLYAAEEPAGRISRIESDGTRTSILTGLNRPEGLAFDRAGNLYVVEDVDNGRLLKKEAGDSFTTVATGLDSPESVIWVDDGSPNGLLYLTESNIERAYEENSFDRDDYRSHVTKVALNGSASFTRLFTKTGLITLSLLPLSAEGKFWSYTGDIALGPDNLLYFSNELSGRMTNTVITTGALSVPFTATSGESIFTLSPTNPLADSVFADGLIAPEGISFSVNGNYPLFVAEEDASTDESGQGRLSQVDSAGQVTVLCTGFGTLEDVIVASNGWLYVSEDSTGLIIQVRRSGGVNRTDQQVWLPLIQNWVMVMW